MEQYLRANPGGPAVSEFDWGTGETPRRSSRISEKAKVTPVKQSEPPKKRRKPSASKENKETETTFEGTGEAKEEAAKTKTDDMEVEVGMDVLKENQDENKGPGAETQKEAAPTEEAGEVKTSAKIDEEKVQENDGQQQGEATKKQGSGEQEKAGADTDGEKKDEAVDDEEKINKLNGTAPVSEGEIKGKEAENCTSEKPDHTGVVGITEKVDAKAFENGSNAGEVKP